MKVELENITPADIEKRSMEIISDELASRGVALDPANAAIIMRCIHTSADFDYVDNLVFSPDAVARGVAALKAGAIIVTDTNMALSGISKPALASLGCTTECHMADADVAAAAKERGVTRAVVSMEKAVARAKERGDEQGSNMIFAIGNAPTALVRLYEMIEDEGLAPALIVGVPVGFVNVVESKELILGTSIPHIVACGRKGGSTIATCIVNALLYETTGRAM